MNKLIETMTKKTMALLLAVAMVATTQATVNVWFSTTGAPDTYADGTVVQDGEAYALVWARDGHAFAGLDLYGNAVDAENNAVLAVRPLAKNGHCTTTMFTIENDVDAQYADGDYQLVLLDTRAEDENGNFVAKGTSGRINGWGLAKNGRVRAMGRARTRSAKRDEEAAVASTSSAVVAVDADNVVTHTSTLPKDLKIANPKITGIEVKDNEVILTVTGGSELLNFNVASGETTACADIARATAGQQGKKTMTFAVPRVEGQCFFRIVRN